MENFLKFIKCVTLSVILFLAGVCCGAFLESRGFLECKCNPCVCLPCDSKNCCDGDKCCPDDKCGMMPKVE